MFEIGEVVGCVDPGRDLGLIKDKHYTIYWLGKDSQGEPMCEILEVDAPEPFIGFLLSRFRKLRPDEQIEVKEEKFELV